jgi:5-hydroxyisourate hydrolase-like protein (transthyretin family)
MITAQVIDTALGRPAALVPVLLDHLVTGGWEELGRGVTFEVCDGQDCHMALLLSPFAYSVSRL